jgi:hypothetical protein
MYPRFLTPSVMSARLGDILNSPPEPAYNPGQTALPAIRGEINLSLDTGKQRTEYSPLARSRTT